MREKIDYFFKKLSTLPECRNNEFYRWADYIELKCLVNADGQYSISEFIDDAKQRAEDLGEGDLEENKEINKLSNSEKNDKWENIAKDTFRVIQNRVQSFEQYYPFEITENNRAILLRESDGKKRVYLFLLLCADLRYTLKFKKELTSSFELASLEVLKELFPNAEATLFGSSNTEEVDTSWESDKLADKLVWLEEFLKEKLRIETESISDYNQGDKGIDLVGKVSLNDDLGHFPIILGQCSCSPHDWALKQHSVKYDSLNQLISLSTYPSNFIFIPQSFRDAHGDWHDETQIHKSILIDRLRIIRNFKNEDLFEKLSSTKVVDAIIKVKAPVFS